jgi:hypothetical protein
MAAHTSTSQRATSSPLPFVLLGLTAIIVAVCAAGSLALRRVDEPAHRSFAFPPFRMVYETSTSQGLQPISFELEWRGRNDWTERLVRADGSIGLVTKEAHGEEVVLYGMGATHTYEIEDGSAYVPGVWFRDIVSTLPTPTESRSQMGSVVTVTRKTPIDIEEWDADAATGIPLAYRTIGDGVVVREIRVVSLVLSDGTVIR